MSCAVSLYLISSLIIAISLRGKRNQGTEEANDDLSKKTALAFAIGAIATVMHLALTARHSFINGQLDFSLGSVAILISGLLCLIFILGGLHLPIRRLGVVVFPLTVLSVLFGWFRNSEPNLLAGWSNAATAHIVVSILSYCLLAIAAIQAILYTYQERQLKKHVSPAMLIALPPLQTMEQLLFRLIWTGFALLSLTLISGMVFTNEIYNRPFEFNHHTILAIMGWLVYVVLLFLRVTQGVRGTQAVYWTIAGFLFIQLGYFGTKLVTESMAVQ